MIIKLTLQDGTPFFIETRRIETVAARRSGSTINQQSHAIKVRETRDEVMALKQAATKHRSPEGFEVAAPQAFINIEMDVDADWSFDFPWETLATKPLRAGQKRLTIRYPVGVHRDYSLTNFVKWAVHRDAKQVWFGYDGELVAYIIHDGIATRYLPKEHPRLGKHL